MTRDKGIPRYEPGAYTRPYKYETAKEHLATIIGDLNILCGDSVVPSDVTWQDVAGTCAVNLRCLAAQLESARAGKVANGPAVFPSVAEAIEGTV
jgi:hypothetical protein